MQREIPDWRGHYTPWIGNAFETQQFWPDVRLLLLGESHYFGDDADDVPSVTGDLIVDATEGRGNRYFNRIPEILLGKRGLSNDERRSVWHAIAFSQICQEAAGKDRVPAPGAFERSKPALYQLVTYLRPTHIVFVSKRGWDNTGYDEHFKKCASPAKSAGVEARRSPHELCRATIDDVAFWMTYILHPTSGHPPPTVESSATVVRELLKLR